MNNLKKNNEEKLLQKYQINRGTLIDVGINHILGQYALLNRHSIGNEDRIKKLGYLIRKNGNKERLANIIEIPFSELMQLYDVSKQIDMRNVEEILQYRQYNLSEYQRVGRINEYTSKLPDIILNKNSGYKGTYLQVSGKRYPLHENIEYKIGRDCDNTIRIDKDAVSRKHCCVTMNRGNIVLKDLKSTNGTFVNGVKITGRRNVNVGDTITVADVPIILKEE